jgi:hypothetical protein
VDFIEQYWYEYAGTPTVNQISLSTGLSENFIRDKMLDPDFQEALKNRGLDILPTAQFLTPEQLATANMLLDFSDERTTRQKLNALGISHRQYSAWLKQRAFKQYVTNRAEQLFGDAMPEAHLALVGNVKRGDLNSIKLFYEMSGRWSSKTIEETNIEFLMMKLIEIIQRHITDPVALAAIAEEIGGLMPSNNSPVGALPSSNGQGGKGIL